jgi:hypothetical protein
MSQYNHFEKPMKRVRSGRVATRASMMRRERDPVTCHAMSPMNSDMRLGFYRWIKNR